MRFFPIIANPDAFEKLCRVIMLTEQRGFVQVEVLLKNRFVRSDPIMTRIFQIVHKDEPDHFQPYQRWLERQGRALFPTIREYARLYGLTAERVKLADTGAIVMHPGPMNRGVEIASEVADGPQSVILNQVTFGIAVRMAVMSILASSSKGV